MGRRIAGPPVGEAELRRAPEALADGARHLEHRVAGAGADVEALAAGQRRALERQHVHLGEVADVDVVAHAGAVGGRVIVAEHVDRDARPGRALKDDGDQVRFRVVVLAAVLSGTGGVEIPKRRGMDSIRPIEPVQGAFECELGLPIRVRGGDRIGFLDRLPGGFAVNWIEKFYADGITAGCNAAPLQYCPDATVTRAQMAVNCDRRQVLF